jgi:hypothetical protein
MKTEKDYVLVSSEYFAFKAKEILNVTLSDEACSQGVIFKNKRRKMKLSIEYINMKGNINTITHTKSKIEPEGFDESWTELSNIKKMIESSFEHEEIVIKKKELKP